MTKDGRNNRRAHSRELILAAARDTLHDGIFNFSMNRVARRSGRSVRTIFEAFGSLDKLRAEVLQDIDTRYAVAKLVVGYVAIARIDDPVIVARIAHAAVFGKTPENM